MNVQNITLELSKEPIPAQIVRMGQGDSSGTTIRATLYDHATIPSLSGVYATFYMRLPDGTHYVRDANCTLEGNVITYVVDEEHCCAVAGYTDEAYFELTDGAYEYSTSRFRVKVERAANDGATPPESWDTGIDEAIRRANEAVEEVEDAIDELRKGEPNGVAELDGSGKVPEAQLPSYVDDVVEYASRSAFPAAGESGKIYVDTSDNKTYRWSGTTYVGISSSLALGETESTAYRGDRGKIAYDHAQAKGSQFASGLYKIATNSEGHVTGATSVQKSDITALGIPSDDTATQSADGLMSAADKKKLDEMDGSTEALTNAQIDTITNDGTVTSTNVLQGTGLTYLWGKLKAKFAALVDGVVAVSQGGTGKSTHTSNAVLTGNGTNAVNNVASANGALYATSANGTPQFGTLPVGQGGTGNTTNTSNAVLTGNGTGAVKNVSTANGAFYSTGANVAAQFGTLPIAQGGTGATTAADAAENIVDGQDIKPASVEATGEVSGKSGTGASAVTHKLTEKLNTEDYRKALKWSEVSDEWLWGEVGSTPSTQGTTYTTNLNLIKPGLETTISVDDFNDNADIVDDAYGKVTSSMADIEQATATSNHSIGDYFLLGGVLMRTTAAIAAGEQITTSNATPETIQSQIDTLRDSLGWKVSVFTKNAGAIAANATMQVRIPLTAPSGYTAVGIVGFGSNSEFVVPFNSYISGSDAVLELKNITSAPYSVPLAFAYILFLRSSANV